MSDGLLRATIDFALIALKTLVLVNGAIVGIMTFVGHVWAEHPASGSALAKALFWPLASFLAGLVVALFTIFLAYVTQIIITEVAGGQRHLGATRLRVTAILFGLGSLVFFAIGCITALLAIAG